MNGPAVSAVPTPEQNRLLAALSGDARLRLFPQLELAGLPAGKTLREAGQAHGCVYFPIDCLVSLVYALGNGASTEIAVVGREGLLGVAAFMGGDRSPTHAVVASAGLAWRLQTQRLKDEFDRQGASMQLLLRYAQSLMTQVAQTAVCNRRHSVDQQLCRWFLLVLDRVADRPLSMTHELIATMLGVRRESVSEAAGKLQALGAIHYSHGHITVLDRARLEQLCCECYAVVRKETERLLPGVDRSAEVGNPRA